MPLFFSGFFVMYLRGAKLVAALRAFVSDDFISPRSRMQLSVGSFGSTPGAFDQQLADLHEIVGEHGSANEQVEALGALGEATLHAAAAHQHRDAALDASAKTLAVLECARSFAGFALRRPAAAALRNRGRGDPAIHARRHVLLTEEAAIGAVEFRTSAEHPMGVLERGYHVDLSAGFPLSTSY